MTGTNIDNTLRKIFEYEIYLTDASENNRVRNPKVKDKDLLNLNLVSFFDLIIKIPQIKGIKNI